MRIVLKFGGTSVATTELIKAIAFHIKELKKEIDEIVIVVSAMGKTTNALIDNAYSISSMPNKREMDALMMTGELQTITLLAIALNEIGVKSKSFNGEQAGFLTDDVFNRAFIMELNVSNIEKALKEGFVVVVAGFQGINENGDFTTLGRGGSDTTSVALAAKLKCPCEIYTDVDSVYTIDPHIVKNPKKIKNITHEEMMELAVNGAKVLDARCIEIAKKYGVPLYLGKSCEKGDKKGTFIMERKLDYFEKVPIKSIALKSNISLIKIKIIDYEKIGDIMSAIRISAINLENIHDYKIDNNLEISFICPNDKIKEMITILNDFGILKDDVSVVVVYKVTLVGIGLSTHSGIGETLVLKLISNNIEFFNLSVNEIAITFLVNSQDSANLSINILKEEFKL